MKTFNLPTKLILAFFVVFFTSRGLGYIFTPIDILTTYGTNPLAKDLIPGITMIAPFIGAYLLSLAALGCYVLKTGNVYTLRAFLTFAISMVVMYIILSIITLSGTQLYTNLIGNIVFAFLYAYLLFKNRV